MAPGIASPYRPNEKLHPAYPTPRFLGKAIRRAPISEKFSEKIFQTQDRIKATVAKFLNEWKAKAS
jgi:hypothetical protein